MHELKPLTYKYDALEPFIDKETMEIHHQKHHKAYVDKLNVSIESEPELKALSAEALVKGWKGLPDTVRQAVRNNAGGHVNHSFFWSILKTGTTPKAQLLSAINEKFGSLESFKEQFANAALSVFGSGWAWLVLKSAKLEIVTTPNQDSPLTDGCKPIIGIDVWEHAYYVKYRNKRSDYVQAFFSVINWDECEEAYKNG
jgi:superoxide dismutase, Fe-Mn family